ncbi:site-specific integrase [Nocardioides panacisoli]|uniref:tyrosine-type recombinase/integrase n=1 Tax=Nocardioides panacisoli TaxID=627624 RepID=UPI001C62B278|nr:site-specific integrase [Nocardioides panacisoli]QYJ05254.1 site-specific integrase [Nocardioides panacisoli]
MASRRGFGAIRKLPSKRFQASYTGPDMVRHKAPRTFQAREDAEAWLAARRAEINGDEWSPPTKQKPITFGEHAERWLTNRPLKPRSRYHYRGILDRHILPTFAGVPLKHITADLVDDWHYRMGDGTPTARAHAYGLLRTILGDAVQRRLIEYNPCHIRGAGNTKRVKQIEPASLEELATLTEAMPQRYRLMVLLAAWCGLRFGELSELRRKDLDLANGVVRVRRAVVRVKGEFIVGTPKSDAGTRDVAIPPHLLPVAKEHLASDITGGRDGLLFPAAGDPGKHLAPATLYRVFYKARDAAGRPDLRFHDLRHTGAVLAASTGATLAELMSRLGHSTAGAALRYQHAAQDRDKAIAEALSALAGE